jgi:hypothetical protein
MSFTDKLQYTVALPGAEFRTRNLTSPVIAIQALHEIDLNFGTNPELCLSILSESFRGVHRVTQVLNENSKNFRKGVPQVEEWKMEAIRMREVRRVIVERRLASVAKAIENLEAKASKLSEQVEEMAQQSGMFNEVEVTPTTEKEEERKQTQQTTKKSKYLSQMLENTHAQITEKESEFCVLAEEIAL